VASQVVCAFVLSAIACVLVGCARVPPQPMAQCYEGRFPPQIQASVLQTALVRATEWSDREYGDDCVVCADFLRQDDKTFTLHITSPDFPDMFINTSAELTVTKADATVVESGKYHSCYVRRVKSIVRDSG
jgi:hypothetical protein